MNSPFFYLYMDCVKFVNNYGVNRTFNGRIPLNTFNQCLGNPVDLFKQYCFSSVNYILLIDR